MSANFMRYLSSGAFILGIFAASVAGAAQPEPWQIGLQEPAGSIAQKATDLHNLLLIIISLISVFVLALLVYVGWRFRRDANPTPSKTTHNTTIEILWTVIPVLILVVIAVPSFRLLYYMDETKNAEMVIKVTGNQWYWNYEYMDDQILTLSIFAKAANSIGDNDVKISNRLYLPSRKLRGFESGKIGPLDGGDYIGGNYLAAFNAQANLPIFQSWETLDFNIFYDAANVWGVDYNSGLNDSSALRSATGIGIDWYTPIGPMSFSFAQPISKKSTDKTEGFRFNIGTTF